LEVRSAPSTTVPVRPAYLSRTDLTSNTFYHEASTPRSSTSNLIQPQPPSSKSSHDDDPPVRVLTSAVAVPVPVPVPVDPGRPPQAPTTSVASTSTTPTTASSPSMKTTLGSIAGRVGRRGVDKVTASLQAASSALSRSVESKDPSRLTVLRVLLQCQDAVQQAEWSIAGFSPGKAMVDAVRQMALAALWCVLRMGARGGPIRRRALDVIRRSGAMAGSFTLLQVITDLQEFMGTKDSSLLAEVVADQLDRGVPGDTAGSAGGSSSAPTVMAELVRTTVNISREDATDVLAFILNHLENSRTGQDEGITAAASIVIACMKGRGLEDRIIEQAAGFVRGRRVEAPLATGLLAIALAPHLKFAHSAESFAADCATMLKEADSELVTKVWSVALSLATASCISLHQPAGMKLAILGEQEFNDAFARVVDASGLQEGRDGAHWVLVSLIHLWKQRASLEDHDSFVESIIRIMSPHLQTYEALVLGNEALYIGLLQNRNLENSLKTLDVLLPIMEDEHLSEAASGLAFSCAAEIVRAVGLSVDRDIARSKRLIDCGQKAVTRLNLFLQEAGAALLAAVASAVPLIRARIVMEAIESLRLTDADLAQNPTRNDSLVYRPIPDPNWVDVHRLMGYARAVALLISESTSYPGVPGALLETGLECSLSLLQRHPLSLSKPASAIIARRRCAGWSLFSALCVSDLRRSLIVDRLPQVMPLWIDELSSMERVDGLKLTELELKKNTLSPSQSRLSDKHEVNSSKDLSEIPLRRRTNEGVGDEPEDSARAAAIAALEACLRTTRTRDLEVVAMTLIGAESARIISANLPSSESEMLTSVVTQRLLNLAFHVSPMGPGGDLVYHIALMAERFAAKEREESLRILLKKSKSKLSKSKTDAARDKLRWNQSNILGLFRSLRFRIGDVDDLLKSCAGAVAAIVSRDLNECSDFLNDLAERKLDVSSPFIGAVVLEICKRLSVSDFSSDGGILISLQILLRRALTTELERLHETPQLSTFEMILGKTIPKQALEQRAARFGEATVALAASAYRELGRKGGIQLWAGLVLSLSDTLTRCVGPQPTLASAVARILGHLLKRRDDEEVEGLSEDPKVRKRLEDAERIGFHALCHALESGLVETQAAAAAALNSQCPVVAELADRLLSGLLASMLFSRGSSDLQVYISDTDLTSAMVDPEGSGDYLADIGHGVAEVLFACQRYKGENIEESVLECAKEIAAELIAWRVDRAPRTRAAGLRCLAGIWGAVRSSDAKDSTSPRRNARTDPLARFCSRELPKSSVRIGICETLSYRGGRDIAEARASAICALQELLAGVGPKVLLMEFPELPECLFNSSHFGCEDAEVFLESITSLDAPGRFSFWYQLCKEVCTGGPQGLRPTGQGARVTPSRQETSSVVPSSSVKDEHVLSEAMRNLESEVLSKIYRWEADPEAIRTAVRVLRVAIDSALSFSPPDVRSNPADAPWTEEPLSSRLEQVVRLCCDVCVAPDAAVGTIVEGMMIFRSICTHFLHFRDSSIPGNPRVILPMLERASSLIASKLTTPQMPEVVRAAGLAAAGIILEAADDDELSIEELVNALLGNDLECLHQRFQYGLLTEEAGAKTTVSVLSTIGMVISESISRKQPSLMQKIEPFLPNLFRVFVAFCGDFAEMFVSGSGPLGHLGGALTSAGTPSEFIQSSFVRNSADIIFAACSMRLLLNEDSFAGKNHVTWISPDSSGALLGRNNPEYLFESDTRDLLFSLLSWWLMIGLKKIQNISVVVKPALDQILSRCCFAVSALRKWPSSSPLDSGILLEVLKSMSLVDPVMGARLSKSLIPDDRFDDSVRQASIAYCALALRKLDTLREASARDSSKIDEAFQIALDLIETLGSVQERRTFADACIDCLLELLKSEDLVDVVRTDLSRRCERMIHSVVDLFCRDDHELLSICNEIFQLHCSRVRCGLETPSNSASHFRIFCTFARAARNSKAVDSDLCTTESYRFLLYVISSNQPEFALSVLELGVAQELMETSFTWADNHPTAVPVVGALWTRIAEWSIRLDPNCNLHSTLPQLGTTASTAIREVLIKDAKSTRRLGTFEAVLSTLLPSLRHILNQDRDSPKLLPLVELDPATFRRLAQGTQTAR